MVRMSTEALPIEVEPEISFGMQVSVEMVRLYKQTLGRGPTSARTHWAGPDTLVVLLEDTLTPAERTMVKLNEHQRLRDTRMFFQHASEDQLIGAVEEITGRKVRAFVSGIDAAKDVSAELFYLEPNGSSAADPEAGASTT